MWASIVEIVLMVMKWFGVRAQEQTDQNNAVTQAQLDHAKDGQMSVADGESSDDQNAALDKIKTDLENQRASIVVKSKG